MVLHLQRLRKAEEPKLSWDDHVRRNIELIGCLTDEELFNGSSFIRACKPRPSRSGIASAPPVMSYHAGRGGSLYARRPHHPKLHPDGLDGYFRWLWDICVSRRRRAGEWYPTFEEWMGNEHATS
jgi:hypothetical protein